MNKNDPKILIPMIRKIIPKVMAAEILGVQPMTMDDDLQWTKWRRTISFWPRRSINGKLIIGPINKSSRDDWGVRPGPGKEVMYMPRRMRAGRRPKRVRRYATDKELFTAKLKGET